MGLLVPVAGAYTATYTKPSGSAQAVGALQEDGFEFSFMSKSQELNDTDTYGGTLVDGIYRGMDVRIRARAKEAGKQGLLDLLQPFGIAPSGNAFYPALSTAASPIGRRYSDLAGSLVLTATANTPAATTGPVTITATQTILAPNSQYSANLTSKIREVPFELALLPFSTTISSVAYLVWFTTT